MGKACNDKPAFIYNPKEKERKGAQNKKYTPTHTYTRDTIRNSFLLAAPSGEQGKRCDSDRFLKFPFSGKIEHQRKNAE